MAGDGSPETSKVTECASVCDRTPWVCMGGKGLRVYAETSRFMLTGILDLSNAKLVWNSLFSVDVRHFNFGASLISEDTTSNFLTERRATTGSAAARVRAKDSQPWACASCPRTA